MKTIWKRRIIAVMMSVFMVLGMFGFGHTYSNAEPLGYIVAFPADVNVSENKVTYTIGDVSVVVNIDSSKCTWYGEGIVIENDSFLAGLGDAVSSINGFDPDTMEIRVEAEDGFSCALIYTDGIFTRADDGGFPDDLSFSIRAKDDRHDGGEGGRHGDSVAHVTAISSDGTWTGMPCVRENYYIYTGDGEDTIRWNYTEMKSWQKCWISVNDGERSHFTDSPEGDCCDCMYEEKENPDFVDVTIGFNWGFRPEEFVFINGTEYKVADYLDFDDRMAWLDAFGFGYRSQDISFTIPDVPADIDGEGVANLSMVIDLRPISDAECYIGNFLWSSNTDENDPESDLYIGHSELTLISAAYPDYLKGTSFDEKTIANESRMSKDEKTAKYIAYGCENGDGEMVLPAGTKVTMRVAPEFGYQVTAFKINGEPVEGGYTAENDVAVFTFVIDKANFHLGADVVPVENEVVAEKTEAVRQGAVELGGTESSMKIGTAKLEVEDVEVSEESQKGFEKAAGDYTVGQYLDVSMFNTVYKGTSADSWDTEVKKLDKPATIHLQLADNDLSDISIVHEKSDGTYELLESQYDSKDKVLTFKTDSFSNYAIVYKPENENADDKQAEEENDVDETTGLDMEFYSKDGKTYWYEGGVRQGTEEDPKSFSYDGTIRGREIYDSATDGWYWLDANAEGAKAVSKEVFMPYVYSNEAGFDEEEMKANAAASDEGTNDYILGCMMNKTGKWVRYDENGKMFKGFVVIEGETLEKLYPDQAGNTYYYDKKTGAMIKGKLIIDGKEYFFDEITGAMVSGS